MARINLDKEYEWVYISGGRMDEVVNLKTSEIFYIKFSNDCNFEVVGGNLPDEIVCKIKRIMKGDLYV